MYFFDCSHSFNLRNIRIPTEYMGRIMHFCTIAILVLETLRSDSVIKISFVPQKVLKWSK